jgi:hypothetical protein
MALTDSDIAMGSQNVWIAPVVSDVLPAPDREKID